jgi:hypothetical protein
VNEPEPAFTNAGESELMPGAGLSAVPVTVVADEAVLFVVFGSPAAALTVAVLVRVPDESEVTVICTVTEPPEVIVPKLHRTTAPALQVPWLGFALFRTEPFGMSSIKVAGAASAGPALLIVSV